MIEDAIMQNVVVPTAMEELGPYIIVGTLSAIMFIGYHLTNRIENRLQERRR